jgi:hypothetical protein
MTVEQALAIKAALESANKTTSPIYEQALQTLRQTKQASAQQFPKHRGGVS